MSNTVTPKQLKAARDAALECANTPLFWMFHVAGELERRLQANPERCVATVRESISQITDAYERCVAALTDDVRTLIERANTLRTKWPDDEKVSTYHQAACNLALGCMKAAEAAECEYEPIFWEPEYPALSRPEAFREVIRRESQSVSVSTDEERIAIEVRKEYAAALELLKEGDADRSQAAAGVLQAKGAASSADPKEPMNRTAEGEWSTPMSKSEMENRLKLTRRNFAAFSKRHGIIKVARQLWQIRTDQMDEKSKSRLDGKAV